MSLLIQLLCVKTLRNVSSSPSTSPPKSIHVTPWVGIRFSAQLFEAVRFAVMATLIVSCQYVNSVPWCHSKRASDGRYAWGLRVLFRITSGSSSSFVDVEVGSCCCTTWDFSRCLVVQVDTHLDSTFSDKNMFESCKNIKKRCLLIWLNLFLRCIPTVRKGLYCRNMSAWVLCCLCSHMNRNPSKYGTDMRS